MHSIASGHLNRNIEAKTSSANLEELKNTINTALQQLSHRFEELNVVLERYASYDYTQELKIDVFEEGSTLDRLIKSVVALKNAIVSMLEASKNNAGDLLVKAQFLQEQMANLDSAIKEQAMMLQDAASKIGSINEVSQETSVKASDVITQSNDIKSVISIIADIAEQTNLLALNAAIEAARAGEHGRGFAVVADEVRKLAERTQKSLAEINANINVLTQSITDIGSAIELQSDDVSQINDTIIVIDEKTKNNTNIVEEVDNVAKEVNEMAKVLLKDVDKNRF
jgi:methyl-accepting chemotaxis protein